jgi:hypothetical protein
MSKKELKFIHITKCAGSYIEELGKKNNIMWGQYHKEYGFWHNFFPNINNEIKNKYDWFMVVRNPYTRILSEYYCEWGGIGKKNINHTEEEMNNYLINKIKKEKKEKKEKEPGYGHYLEQYKYLDDEINIHIIKFENLIEELTNLFKEYNINIKLEEKKINTKEMNSYDNEIKFTLKDFSKELIDLINNVYDKDFELFNYQKKYL